MKRISAACEEVHGNGDDGREEHHQQQDDNLSQQEGPNGLDIHVAVREALIELSRFRLVEILPQRGSYISKIDYALIEESRFVRVVIESAVLKLACQGIDQSYMDKLNENLEMQKQVHKSGDAEKFLTLDNEFHQLIFASVGKNWSYKIVKDQMVHFDRLRSLSLRSLNTEYLLKDHEDLVYAIIRQDSEMAEMLLNRHLMRHQMKKSELLERYPDYFV